MSCAVFVPVQWLAGTIFDRICARYSPALAVLRQVWLFPVTAVCCNPMGYGTVMIAWPHWPLRVTVVLCFYPLLLIATNARGLCLLMLSAVCWYWPLVVVGGRMSCSAKRIDDKPFHLTCGFWLVVLRPVWSFSRGSLHHPGWNSGSTFYRPCYKRCHCCRPANCYG